jgi:hypothetical protein
MTEAEDVGVIRRPNAPLHLSASRPGYAMWTDLTKMTPTGEGDDGKIAHGEVASRHPKHDFPARPRAQAVKHLVRRLCVPKWQHHSHLRAQLT